MQFFSFIVPIAYAVIYSPVLLDHEIITSIIEPRHLKAC